MKIITDMEHLTKPCNAISYKDSLNVANKMKMFLLTNKNIAKKTIGLACNQLGLPGRVILYKNGEAFKHLINPEITHKSDDMITTKEDCLSVPNKSVYVQRHRNITLQQWKDEINWDYFKPTSYQSIVIQHEIDHLNGITIMQTDYIMSQTHQSTKEEYNEYSMTHTAHRDDKEDK